MLAAVFMRVKRSLEKRSASRQIDTSLHANGNPGRGSRFRATVRACLLIVSCLSLARAAEAAPSFRLVTAASPGNYVSDGIPQLYRDPAENVFPTVWDRSSPGGPDFFRLFVDYGTGRFFGFDIGTDGLARNLAPGEYINAERAPFASVGHPGLDIFMDGRGCNQVSGKFYIHSVSISSSQDVDAIDVSFTHYCEGREPSLIGRFTYNASGLPIASLAPYEVELPKAIPTLGGVGTALLSLALVVLGLVRSRQSYRHV